MFILIQLGIEPAVFGLVTHCLNQLLLRVPPPQVAPLGIEPIIFRLVSDSTGNPTHGIPTCWWTQWEDNPRHSGLSLTPLGIETTAFRLETNWIEINLFYVGLKSVICLAINSNLRWLVGTNGLSNFFSRWDYSYYYDIKQCTSAQLFYCTR